MPEIITQLVTFAPGLIFIASTLDIFFATGFVFYGWAMMGSVAAMHATGLVSVEMIILSAYGGTVCGNLINYGVGRLFSETKFVADKLTNPKIKKLSKVLTDRGLFIFMLVSRFITLSRPLYALLLGSLGTHWRRFLIYELFIALCWVLFWLFIILQGENIYFYFFG